MTEVGGAPRRVRDERGVYLILYSVLTMVLFAIAALVLDMSSLRTDRRDGRLITDAAAAAGGMSLAETERDGEAACGEAWSYVLSNRTTTGGAVTAPDCTSMSAACDNVTTGARVAAGTSGPYTVRIVHPVPNTSSYLTSAALVGGDRAQAYDSTSDGLPCERIAVEVTRTRSLAFAKALGMSSGTTTVHSVGRGVIAIGQAADVPALVALRANDCPAISAKGRVEALAVGTRPGIIWADSAGTGPGCASAYVHDASGGGGGIHALATAGGTPGQIGFVSDVARGYNAASPNSYTGVFTKLAEKTTREPVDLVYHCNRPPLTCSPPGTPATDAFETRLSPLSGPGAPAGYTTWPGLLETCAVPLLAYTGNVYINCPAFSITTAMSFTGNVVFAGSVDVGSGGHLTVSPLLPATSSIIAVRGDFITSSNQSRATFVGTTLYQPIDPAGLPRRFISDNGITNWTAPPSGRLKNLLYWNESGGNIEFKGTPNFFADGVWFAPNSLMSLVGNAQMTMTNVQVWVSSVSLQDAAAKLTLAPNPVTAVSLAGFGARLIR